MSQLLNVARSLYKSSSNKWELSEQNIERIQFSQNDDIILEREYLPLYGESVLLAVYLNQICV